MRIRLPFLLFAVSFSLPVFEAAGDDQLKVSPTDEIVILDPKLDSRRRPAPQVVPSTDGYGQVVEIPPTVIIHRYYYTGDRDFQGPRIPGGPSVLVLNHPVTGQQLSIQAQLLPGAPRIHYSDRNIRYDYGDRNIIVHFGLLDGDEPKVIYQRHPELVATTAGYTSRLRDGGRDFIRRTRLPELARAVRQRTGDAVLATGDRIGQVGSGVAGRVRSLWDATPVSGLLTPENRPDAALNDARTGIIRELEDTVPSGY